MRKKILWHVTPVGNLKKILNEGIRSNGRIYLTDDPLTWITIMSNYHRHSEKFAILRIDIDWDEYDELIKSGKMWDLDHSIFTEGPPGEIWWHAGNISPDRIVAFYIVKVGGVVDRKYRTSYFKEMKKIDIGNHSF